MDSHFNSKWTHPCQITSSSEKLWQTKCKWHIHTTKLPQHRWGWTFRMLLDKATNNKPLRVKTSKLNTRISFSRCSRQETTSRCKSRTIKNLEARLLHLLTVKWINLDFKGHQTLLKWVYDHQFNLLSKIHVSHLSLTYNSAIPTNHNPPATTTSKSSSEWDLLFQEKKLMGVSSDQL
jgi:hypothetical protein